MTPALIGLTALWLTGCSSTRSVTGTSDYKYQEARVESVVDSLCENISQNLNDNLTEHEVITETIIRNDSVKVERITDRVTVRDRSAKTEAKKEEVRVQHDTVFVQKTNSSVVLDRASPWVLTLKWVIVIGIALIGLMYLIYLLTI